MVTPIFPSSAYDYENAETLYPRYFNTPNQDAVVRKLVALENGEDGLVFSSGMAAIMTSLLAILKKGDHAIFQNDLYGGTFHAVVNELPRFGIEFSLVDGTQPQTFTNAIRSNTKMLYVETPSNPTLKLVPLRAIVDIARNHGLYSMIDNTFASPVNQNPLDFGMDIVAHSGTKYIGGHSDICCGAIVTSSALTNQIRESALHFGGSLDAQTCWLVERSLKTIVLRVRQQNYSAQRIAEFLFNDERIGEVYYPGLPSHRDHVVAKEQMPGGFGGMVAFEVKNDPHGFIQRLQLIRRAVSLGGVESTICSPARTSHVKMNESERLAIGVTENLVRLSVGIEDTPDLIADLEQALK